MIIPCWVIQLIKFYYTYTAKLPNKHTCEYVTITIFEPNTLSAITGQHSNNLMWHKQYKYCCRLYAPPAYVAAFESYLLSMGIVVRSLPYI